MIISRDKLGQSGFTILEVIVSIAIFGIGILAVSRMEILATRANTLAGSQTEGAILVQDVIERVVAAPYDDPSLADTDTDGAGGLDDTGAAADFTFTLNNHSVSWNIVDDTPDPLTKTIRVIVNSNTPSGNKTTTFDFIKGQLTS